MRTIEIKKSALQEIFVINEEISEHTENSYIISAEDLISACALFINTKKEMEEDNE